jgi:hypothetical protein
LKSGTFIIEPGNDNGLGEVGAHKEKKSHMLTKKQKENKNTKKQKNDLQYFSISSSSSTSTSHEDDTTSTTATTAVIPRTHAYSKFDTLSVIPVYLHYCVLNSAMRVCDLMNADYFLVHIRQAKGPHPPLATRVGFRDGSAMPATAVYNAVWGVTLYYSTTDIALTALKGRAMQSVSRLFAPPGSIGFWEDADGQLNHPMQSIAQFVTVKPRHVYNWFNKLYTDGAQQTIFPVEAVSAGHMRYATWAEVRCKPLTFWFRKARAAIEFMFVNSRTGFNEAFSVGYLIWYASLPSATKEVISNTDLVGAYRYKTAKDWVMHAVDFSGVCKALQNTVTVDLTPLFEINTLINRGPGAIDWVKERENRVSPTLARADPRQVYSIARELFTETAARGAKPRAESFDRFWQRRWEWATTGSHHSQYDGEEEKTHRLLRHKLYYICRQGYKQLSDFTDRPAQVHAWPSTKYEWGKQRAIYGVDYTNYVVTTFAMQGCEDVLDDRFPICERAEESQVHRNVGSLLKNGVSCCVDFADFNSQHSFTSMVAVLDAYIDVYGAKLSEEQRVALIWVRRSISTTVVHCKTTGMYRCNGTLMSGWRLTTFMNTVLNYVYKELAAQGLSYIPALHNGDDIIMAIHSLSEFCHIARGMHGFGARLQLTKCYTGSIAEFLRVDHKRGDGGQYLARSISTFVHGKTEAVVPNKVRDVIAAIAARANEAIRRGGDSEVIMAMRDAMFAYTEHRWALEEGLAADLTVTHASVGGLATTIEGTIQSRFEDLQFIDPRNEQTGVDYDIELPGVYDMVMMYEKRLGVTNLPRNLMQSLRAVIFDAVSKTKVKVVRRPPLGILEAAFRRTCYKRFAKAPGSQKVKMCYSYGIPVVASTSNFTALASHLQQYDNPADYVTLLA